MLDAATFQAVALPHQDAATAYERCQVPSGSRPVWCVVATYPLAERRAHAALHRIGFTAYLPLISVRWADRTWHTRPLFPGYCFVRMRLDRPWSPITYAPGVFSLLSVDGKPATCSDTVVEAVQAAEDVRRTPTTRESLYRPGAPCEAIVGGGEPIDAVVIAVNHDRAVVAAMMFGHLREINVGLDSLRLRGE